MNAGSARSKFWSMLAIARRWISTDPIRGQLELLAILATPIFTFLLLFGLSAVARVATSPSCNLRAVAFDVLRLSGRSNVSCNSVPFSVDFPSWVLACTSLTALVIFTVFCGRIKNLRRALTATGVLHVTEEYASDFNAEVEGFVEKTRPRSWLVIPGALILGVGILFYFQTYSHGELFRDLASVPAGADPLQSEQFITVRYTWWANLETHPVLGLLWIAIGSVGTFAALYQAYMYALLLLLMKRLKTKPLFRFIPRWQDRDYGWRPVSRILSVGYLGSLNFLISLIMVVYMIRDANLFTGRNILLLGISVGGIVSNGLFILYFIRSVRYAHIGGIDKTMHVISSDLEPEPSATDSRAARAQLASIFVYVNLLSDSRRYPVKSKARFLFSAIPGAAAVIKLIIDVFK